MNQKPNQSLDIPKRKELTVKEFMALKDHIIIDSRDNANGEYIPKSINISLQSQLAHFLGSLFLPTDKFLIVADEGKEDLTYLRFSRIGYDQIAGHLKGGFKEWKNSGQPIE